MIPPHLMHGSTSIVRQGGSSSGGGKRSLPQLPVDLAQQERARQILKLQGFLSSTSSESSTSAIPTLQESGGSSSSKPHDSLEDLRLLRDAHPNNITSSSSTSQMPPAVDATISKPKKLERSQTFNLLEQQQQQQQNEEDKDADVILRRSSRTSESFLKTSLSHPNQLRRRLPSIPTGFSSFPSASSAVQLDPEMPRKLEESDLYEEDFFYSSNEDNSSEAEATAAAAAAAAAENINKSQSNNSAIATTTDPSSSPRSPTTSADNDSGFPSMDILSSEDPPIMSFSGSCSNMSQREDDKRYSSPRRANTSSNFWVGFSPESESARDGVQRRRPKNHDRLSASSQPASLASAAVRSKRHSAPPGSLEKHREALRSLDSVVLSNSRPSKLRRPSVATTAKEPPRPPSYLRGSTASAANSKARRNSSFVHQPTTKSNYNTAAATRRQSMSTLHIM